MNRKAFVKRNRLLKMADLVREVHEGVPVEVEKEPARPGWKLTTMRMKPELHKALKVYAEMYHLTMAQVIILALKQLGITGEDDAS